MSGMLQRLKRWGSLKHHMWSVGFKEKALRSLFEIKDEGTSKRKTARSVGCPKKKCKHPLF
jgi:hypothetical protein